MEQSEMKKILDWYRNPDQNQGPLYVTDKNLDASFINELREAVLEGTKKVIEQDSKYSFFYSSLVRLGVITENEIEKTLELIFKKHPLGNDISDYISKLRQKNDPAAGPLLLAWCRNKPSNLAYSGSEYPKFLMSCGFCDEVRAIYIANGGKTLATLIDWFRYPTTSQNPLYGYDVDIFEAIYPGELAKNKQNLRLAVLEGIPKIIEMNSLCFYFYSSLAELGVISKQEEQDMIEKAYLRFPGGSNTWYYVEMVKTSQPEKACEAILVGCRLHPYFIAYAGDAMVKILIQNGHQKEAIECVRKWGGDSYGIKKIIENLDKKD